MQVLAFRCLLWIMADFVQFLWQHGYKVKLHVWQRGANEIDRNDLWIFWIKVQTVTIISLKFIFSNAKTSLSSKLNFLNDLKWYNRKLESCDAFDEILFISRCSLHIHLHQNRIIIFLIEKSIIIIINRAIGMHFVCNVGY